MHLTIRTGLCFKLFSFGLFCSPILIFPWKINNRHEEIASSTNDGLNMSQKLENRSHSVHVVAEKGKYSLQKYRILMLSAEIQGENPFEIWIQFAWLYRCGE